MGWGFHGWLGFFVRKVVKVSFGIWEGIPLFWDVDPVKALVEDSDG